MYFRKRAHPEEGQRTTTSKKMRIHKHSHPQTHTHTYMQTQLKLSFVQADLHHQKDKVTKSDKRKILFYKLLPIFSNRIGSLISK